MKLHVIAPTPYFSSRGCHIRIHGLTVAAEALGYEPEIYTYHIGDDYGHWPVHRIRGLSWYSYRGPGGRWGKILLDIQLRRMMKKMAHEGIVHAHLHEGGWIASRLSLPYVLDIQGSLVEEIGHSDFSGRTRVLIPLWRRIERKILTSAPVVITSSPWLTEHIAESYGVEAITVEDGVDTDLFRPVEPSDDTYRTFGVPEDRPVVGYLGGLGREKGVFDLLEAFASLDHENWVLLLGGYPGQEAVKKRADELGIGGSVITPGEVPYNRAAEFISIMDVAVAPKTGSMQAEGKILSYASCGRRTVAFDSRYSRVILGDRGFYFTSPDDMADAIERAMEASMERGKVDKILRERTVERHDWRARGRILKGIYYKLL